MEPTTPPLRRIAVLALVAASSLAGALHAGWVPGPKLTNFPTITLGERFGFSNATNGDFLAVGAPDAIIQAANGAGAVYMFKRTDDTWAPAQKLFAPAGPPGRAFGQFGNAVAMSRDTMVVGAWGYGGPDAELFAGAVFVYTRNPDTDAWQFRATLRASDLAPIDQFGWSVSVDMPETGNGVIAVGKILDGDGNRGAVYVFEGAGATWAQVAKLAPADLGVGDQFGSAVSVRGSTLVAGTQKQNNGGVNAGAAYVFVKSGSTWSQAVKLLPPGLAAGDAFGASVALGDGLIAIGSPGRASGSVAGVGIAYIYEGSGSSWTVTPVQQRNPFQNDAFGYSVAVVRPIADGPEPMVIVGSPGYDSGLANNGAAFAFRKPGLTWELDSTDLFVAGSIANGALGRAVSVSPDGLRSALSSESPSSSAGAAYAFKFEDTGGGTSPGSGGSGGDTGGQIPGGGVPPTGVDTGGGGGGGGGIGTPGTPTPLPPLQADFGTVIGSIVVVNPITRTVMAMQTDGKHENHIPKFEIITTFPEGYELVACPDLNGDGSGDLLFHESSTGLLHGWLRNGLLITMENEIGELPDGFDFATFGSFNGDAIDDLLLRNSSTGDLKLWIMSATGELFREIDVDVPDANWVPLQVDVDGDGRPDLVLRQPGSGELVSLAVTLTGAVTVTPWPDAASDYTLCAGGDLDGDGAIDMLWKNESQGQFEVWLLDGNRLERRRLRFILDASAWRVERLFDFDGNGKADFLMSRNGTGRLVIVYMDFDESGPKIIKSRRYATIDTEMEIVDFATR